MHQPSHQILKNYAKILLNYALNSGQGIKKGEVVFLQVPESAKPLLFHLYQITLDSGAHPIVQYIPDQMQRTFFDSADDNQISFFPAIYLKGKIEQADHFLTIMAETDKHELEGIDPKRILQKHQAFKPYLDWRRKKETAGKFTWTLGLYPTPAMAKEAGLTLQQCWQQVIKACFLDAVEPIKKWQSVNRKMSLIKNKLNQLDIDHLHIKSQKTDLWVKIGSHRSWAGGSGQNIPSFEIFTSPDWRGTKGYIYFNQPLYRYGHLINGVYLKFEKGRVIESKANKGERVLKEMIKTKNADKIGEISLTDSRFSKIDRFMAETLYDENMREANGNVHLALGARHHECFTCDLKKNSRQDWQKLGFNDSVVHTDIISTLDRTVTAYLKNGRHQIIYRHGRFVL